MPQKLSSRSGAGVGPNVMRVDVPSLAAAATWYSDVYTGESTAAFQAALAASIPSADGALTLQTVTDPVAVTTVDQGLPGTPSGGVCSVTGTANVPYFRFRFINGASPAAATTLTVTETLSQVAS